MNTTNDESKKVIAHKSSQVLDKARQEGASTSTTVELLDASQSSNQDSVFLTEEPSSLPPPPRKKSGATLITLPAEDVRLLSNSRGSTSSSKTHTRTNTFGTISNEKFGERQQPRAIKEEGEITSSRRVKG